VVWSHGKVTTEISAIHEYNPPEYQIYDAIKKNNSLPFLDVLECK
jgi:hypothetical protein